MFMLKSTKLSIRAHVKHRIQCYEKKPRAATNTAPGVQAWYPYFARVLKINTTIIQGPLNKIVKRRLNMLSFYKFSERLQQTATFYPGVVIKRGSEAYTSKQCGGCGILSESLGASEVFDCKNCGLKADRDMHAARNILLRHLA